MNLNSLVSRTAENNKVLLLDKYPVLPSFDHWRFPHGDIPAPWSSLTIPSAGLSVNLKQKIAALSRDGTCRISGYLDAVEVAHIVPRASGYWFEYNSMARYNSRDKISPSPGENLDAYLYTRYARLSDVPQQVDDDQNLITLRRDLHYLFDQRRFTFVVKQPRESDSLQVVTHVLCAQGSTELISLYHNRLPQPLSGISTEFLFTRFAWSLFDNTTFPFLQGLQSYKVLVYDLSTSQYSTKDLKAGKIRDAAVLFQSYPQSRNPSPRKRTNDEISKGNADAEMGWFTGDDVSSGEEDYPPRGRHRRRCVEWDSSFEEPSQLAGSTSSASPPTSQDVLKLDLEEPSLMTSDPECKKTLDSSNLVLHLERGRDG
ncbi:hypothetical protein Neosp_014719 [[Neocosmospora] mangrovei]